MNEYVPVSDVQVGHWYDTGSSAIVKVLDKLQDCFIVIQYDSPHAVFNLTTRKIDYSEVWMEIDGDTYPFYVVNTESDNEYYKPFNIADLNESMLL